MTDWGVGRYELTAAELEPAAIAVVGLAGLASGERLLDVGCGTGNAVLAAARAGAEVTALDPSARLVEVARERLAAAGVDATVLVGDAQALPFADGSFDVVLSVFAVIFAPDAERAIGEVVRVLRPGGRALVSVWLPAGTINTLMSAFRRAIAEVTGAPPQPFPWGDVEAVAAVAGRHGATVVAHDRELAFTGDSPEAYFAAQEEHHPLAIAGRSVLEGAGAYDALRAEGLAILRAGNEQPDGFRVTSPYRVLELRAAG